MGSHCLTMSPSKLLCVVATCVLGVSGVSIVAPRTAILPLLTPTSIHSPQFRFQHLSPPVQFQPRLVCSSCSCSGDFWCASYCPSCSSADYCASCSCTSSRPAGLTVGSVRVNPLLLHQALVVWHQEVLLMGSLVCFLSFIRGSNTMDVLLSMGD